MRTFSDIIIRWPFAISVVNSFCPLMFLTNIFPLFIVESGITRQNILCRFRICICLSKLVHGNKNNALYCGVVQHGLWLIFIRIESFVAFLFMYAHNILFLGYSSLNLVSLDRTFYADSEYVYVYPNWFTGTKIMHYIVG